MPQRVGPQMQVERVGSKVTLTLTCANDYEAIVFYDQVTEGLMDGMVTLDFTSKPAKADT